MCVIEIVCGKACFLAPRIYIFGGHDRSNVARFARSTLRRLVLFTYRMLAALGDVHHRRITRKLAQKMKFSKSAEQCFFLWEISTKYH